VALGSFHALGGVLSKGGKAVSGGALFVGKVKGADEG
jgi:hypothetical protein